MVQQQGNQLIFSFFGPPGSGKGTLARSMQKKYDFNVLSTGDLCRQHVAQKSDLGKIIADCLVQGKLVPDDLINQMVKQWFSAVSATKKPIILDGYPRTEQQAKTLLATLKSVFKEFNFIVIYFEIAEEEIIRRLTNRLVCEDKSCQAIYSTVIPPKTEGICDKCASKLIQRSDDNVATIRERLSYYPEYKKELFSFYKGENLPIEEFGVTSVTPEEVLVKFENVLTSIGFKAQQTQRS